MQHILALIIAGISIQISSPEGKKGLFTPFEQSFTVLGDAKVDSIVLYRVADGPFEWRRRELHVKFWDIIRESGHDELPALTSFDRKQFTHSFDKGGIYSLAFFRKGRELWGRHFLLIDAKWSRPPNKRHVRGTIEMRMNPLGDNSPSWIHDTRWTGW